jgi:acetyltransferase
MNDSLRRLLAPRSIAIIGASEDSRKISGRPLKFLLEKGYRGKILPVNPRYQEIAGLRCYPSAAAVPEPVDLAIVAVPAAAVPAAIEDLARNRAGAAVVFSSGFGELGEAGKQAQEAMLHIAQGGALRICGPNCLGLINAFENVIATFGQFADGPTPAGPIGFVTQSGAFGTAIAALARRRGLGLGYFVNTGNESDVSFAEVMRAVIEDPRITVGAGYIEGLKDGAALVELATRALRLGKPLVVTKVGRTSAGARAAASHTGALAGEDRVFAGVARQFAIIRAHNEEHMLDLVEVFRYCALPDGSGLGIVTQSGGAGVLMADRGQELGLTITTLADSTVTELAEVVPGFGVTQNPVDVTGQFVAEPILLRRSVEIMLADPGVHVGIVWLQLMDAHVDTLVDIFCEIKATVAKPFVVCWVAAPQAAITGLNAMGIAVLRGAEPAVEAVAGLVEYAAARKAWLGDQHQAHGEPAFASPLPDVAGVVPSIAAQALLRAAEIPLAPIEIATSAEAAVRCFHGLRTPVALKIESRDVPHKSDAGGVLLNLDDEEAIRAGYASILDRVTRALPDARISGIAVQPMAKRGVEFVIGLKRDPVFGVVVLAGLGGIFVEVLRDFAVRRAPVTIDEALRMLAELTSQTMLDGARRQPVVDRIALATVISRVSRMGHAMQERLRELDLNPIICAGASIVAVDWLLVLND